MTNPLDRLTEALKDRYTLQRELGRGGMATVYLATDLKHERPVALKVLRPELAQALGPERFVREIKLTAALDHPHILPLLDSGDAGGQLFYVMPYVEGESLRERLNREPQLPLDTALQIAREVADALAYAHGRDVVHRDIKPENILLAAGHARVADFGIARAITAAGGDRLTETGLAVGTPAYMSPEQASGSEDVDGRSDLYSLGCVLYEMLSGETPYAGPTPRAILAKKLSAPLPRVTVVRDTVPAHIETALTKVLARTPSDRYLTAAAFKEAIQVETGASPTAGARRSYTAALRVAAVVVLLGLAFLLGRRIMTPAVELDANRIMVFPLVVSEGFPGSPSVGEDVATMIGNTLDGMRPLRWIDGWGQLDPDRRDDIRALSQREARVVARNGRCGYYVTGRIIAQDSKTAQIALTLHDVRDGTEVTRSAATVPIDEVWRGVRAVNGLLPVLIPGTAPDGAADWENRPPRAIAGFLLGEAAFRRVHMDEALEQYRAALAADSTFALAALRGAQAASWRHRDAEAAALIGLARRQPLAPRDEAFTRGYQAYLAGDADAAIVAFREALAIDDQMAVTWLQLGETWTHLLPEAGSPDDSALVAFQEVIRLDPGATNVLFHIIEILLRRGDTVRAAPLLARFLEAGPDARYAAEVRIMFDCVRLGPARMPWDSLAQTAPFELMVASHQLGGGGAQVPCAEAGFRALVRNDTGATPEADNRRYWEVLGLQNLLLAQGREEEMLAQVDSFVRRWRSGTSLFLLGAPYYPRVAERGDAVARDDADTYGPTYAGLQFGVRAWELGVLAAKRGNVTLAQAVADRLARRGASGELPHGEVLATSIEAHVALARGDTGRAMQILEAVVPPHVPSDELQYDEALAGGPERLEYARLLAARGDYARAIAVADVFDAAGPFVYTLYLRPSLALRADAAAALGDARRESRFRARLHALEARADSTP